MVKDHGVDMGKRPSQRYLACEGPASLIFTDAGQAPKAILQRVCLRCSTEREDIHIMKSPVSICIVKKSHIKRDHLSHRTDLGLSTAWLCHLRLVTILSNHQLFSCPINHWNRSQYLNDWLQGNICCNSRIIFDNNEDNTDSAVLLSSNEQALREVGMLSLMNSHAHQCNPDGNGIMETDKKQKTQVA